MELRVLRYFLTVAETENISRAAELLHLTQPTLSRQLMNLEQELGVKLFSRGKSSITLTPEGMLLKRRARDIVYLADKTEREVSSKDGVLSGVISIGVGEMHGSTELTDAVAGFRKLHPEVQFDIYSDRADAVREKIDKGVLDLGLLMMPVDASRFSFVELRKPERWGVMVREDSPIAEMKNIRPQDLAGVPLILTKDPAGRTRITNWFGEYGGRMNVAATFNLEYNAYQLVKAGVGAAVCFMKEGFPSGGVCCIPIEPKSNMHLAVGWDKRREQTKAVREFIEYVKERI